MSSPPEAPAYAPHDDRSQTAWRVEGYPRSLTRSPDGPRIRRPLTLTELTGPQGLDRRLAVNLADLSRITPEAPRAQGELMILNGQVVDEEGRPASGAIVEMWQANASGKYIHAYDQSEAPVDPNFIGSGRFQADAEGRFSFTTVKPGAYPVPESDWWWRPPHIHFSIFGGSWMTRLVTQIFLPGEPLNEHDLLLNSVPDPEARRRLIATALPPLHGPRYALLYEHRFVLRGRAQTPALG
jgi:protocatechuate 3,4-dioxygenase beta subunit